MYLLTETQTEIESITEDTSTGKKIYLEGIYSSAGKKNRNGRLYSRSVLEAAVNNYNEKYVKVGKAIGENNHPGYAQPDFRMASILIESLEWNGDNVIGKASVMSTPEGNIVKGLIESGYKIGISSRGTGSVKSVSGVNEVQADFSLSAYDLVSNPSNYGSEMDVMLEGYLCEGVWTPGKQEIITDLQSASKKDLQEAKMKAFKKMLNFL